jgi:hypothetical protein
MRAWMCPFLLAASPWTGATSVAAVRCARDPHAPDDEAAALCASAGRASRDGGVLRLTTTAGPIEFRDTRLRRENRVLGRLPQIQLAC